MARRDEESLLRNGTRIAVDRLYVLRVWRASKSHELLLCVRNGGENGGEWGCWRRV